MPKRPSSTLIGATALRTRRTSSCAEAREAPRTQFDRRYWLEHCEGYRVDSAEGRLGFVDEVRSEPSRGDFVLAVRAGLLGRRLLLVPAGEVAFVIPRAERIWLRSPVSLVAGEART